MSQVSINVSAPGAAEAAEAIKKVAEAQGAVTDAATKASDPLAEANAKVAASIAKLKESVSEGGNVAASAADDTASKNKVEGAAGTIKKSVEDLLAGGEGLQPALDVLEEKTASLAEKIPVIGEIVAAFLAPILGELVAHLLGAAEAEEELARASINSAEQQLGAAKLVEEAADLTEEAMEQMRSDTDLLIFRVERSEDTFRKQQKAIEDGTEAIGRRLDAQKELQEAERQLAEAQVDAGEGTEAEKLEKKRDIEKKAMADEQKRVREQLDAEKAALLLKKSLGEARSAQLIKQIREGQAITNQQRAAEGEAKALEKEKAKADADAIALYRRAKNVRDEEEKETSGITGRIADGPLEKVDPNFKPASASPAEIRAEAQRLLKNVNVETLQGTDKNIIADLLVEGQQDRDLPGKIDAAKQQVEELKKRADLLREAEKKLADNYVELQSITAKIGEVTSTKTNKEAVFAAQNKTAELKSGLAIGNALEAEAAKNKAEDAKRQREAEKQKREAVALAGSAKSAADLMPQSIGKDRLKAAALKVESGDMAALQQVLDLSKLLVEKVESSEARGARQIKEIADLRRRLNNQRSNDNSGE